MAEPRTKARLASKKHYGRIDVCANHIFERVFNRDGLAPELQNDGVPAVRANPEGGFFTPHIATLAVAVVRRYIPNLVYTHACGFLVNPNKSATPTQGVLAIIRIRH